jgi:hypothetical protein
MQFNDKMVKIVCGVLAVAIGLPLIIGAIAMFN